MSHPAQKLGFVMQWPESYWPLQKVKWELMGFSTSTQQVTSTLAASLRYKAMLAVSECAYQEGQKFWLGFVPHVAIGIYY